MSNDVLGNMDLSLFVQSAQTNVCIFQIDHSSQEKISELHPVFLKPPTQLDVSVTGISRSLFETF